MNWAMLFVGIGLIVLGVVLFVAVKVFQDHPVGQWAVVLIMALGAGFVGSQIPGALNVKFEYASAVGAAAFFLVALGLGYAKIVTPKDDGPPPGP